MARYMPKWVQSLFSIDPAAITAFSGFLTISYQHPFQLAVLVAVPIAAATALLAGDIEQRTIGLVLARPINRFQVVLAAAFVCLLWPALGVLASVSGTLAGAKWVQLAEPLNLQLLATVGVNLYLLIAAIGMLSLLISSAHDERGDAVGWSVTVALLMYVWNFLAQLWATSGTMPNYSLFRFFTPAAIMLRGADPSRDLIILGGVGLAALVAACVIFRVRDISV